MDMKLCGIQKQELHFCNGTAGRDGICLRSGNQWQNAGCERVQGCSNSLKIKKERKP